MAKPGDWNAEVLMGVEVAGSLRQGVIEVGTTRRPIFVDPTLVKWVLIHNLSSVNIWVGGSTVTSTGATRGVRLQPNAIMTLNIHDLSEVYLIATSGETNEVAYLGGVPGA